jgi:hypothetical protein
MIWGGTALSAGITIPLASTTDNGCETIFLSADWRQLYSVNNKKYTRYLVTVPFIMVLNDFVSK